MADLTAMSRHGVAWWASSTTAGRCTCCGVNGPVYRGYNGGQGLSVYFCGHCKPSKHIGCVSSGSLLPDARERLARHLFIAATGGGQLAGNEWDGNTISEYTRNHWLGCADAALAVITGKGN